MRIRAFAAALLALATVQTAAAETGTGLRRAVQATLPNGLRVVLVPDRLAPVVTTQITYLVGSNDAPDGFPGTAHALEHMMFRGSRGLDRDQLAAIGARLGGSYNAETTETSTRYYYTAPAADLPVLLRIEALRMNGLDLAAADWDRERGAIEQEVSRDLSNPFYVYLSQLRRVLFAGTPEAHDALGTRPSFDRTSIDMLRAFYERWYAPNNAVLVVAGDIDPDRALAAVRTAFGGIPRKTLPAHKPVTPAPAAAARFSFDTDYPVAFATLAWRLPSLASPDFAAADILGDVLASKRFDLYGLVPAGKALAASYLYEPSHEVGFGVAYAAFSASSDPKPVLDDLRRVLGEVAAHGVPADLVEAARRKEIAQLLFAPDDISELASSWSRALVDQDLASPDAIAAAYRRVTPADVARIARAWLDPAHAITAVLVPRQTGKPVAGRGFGGAETFAVPPDHPVVLPDWAATALTRLELPPPVPGASDTMLPNGIRLIVHPTDVADTVCLYGLVRQEPALEEPAGKEGVADVAETLFDYGTQQHGRLAFRGEVDAIAADLDVGRMFTLKVPARDFARGVDLLAENETRPALPESAFALVRRQMAERTAGLQHAPGWLFERAELEAILPAGDAERRVATPATISALSLADVRDYVARAYRPDLVTIVVVGHVKPADARREIERAFGGWKASGRKPPTDLPPVGPGRAVRRFVADPTTLQSEMRLSEELGIDPRDPERVALDLGNMILGNGFSSRLYRDLRIRTGDVYGVTSQLDWQRTRTSYKLSFGTDAAKLAEARRMAIEDVRAMQEAPVTPAELELAKAATLRRLPLRRASADDLALEDLALVDRDLPLDQPDRDARAALGTDAAAVQAAMKRIDTAALSEIVKGPPIPPEAVPAAAPSR